VSPDGVNHLAELRVRHQELDDKADNLSSQRFLSSAERAHLHRLKVLRLRCRDEIDSLVEEIERERE
jgi:uncharacterized protein YdcH (DUF465 family)